MLLDPFNILVIDEFDVSVPLTLFCGSVWGLAIFISCHCGILVDVGAGGNWNLNQQNNFINQSQLIVL